MNQIYMIWHPLGLALSLSPIFFLSVLEISIGSYNIDDMLLTTYIISSSFIDVDLSTIAIKSFIAAI